MKLRSCLAVMFAFIGKYTVQHCQITFSFGFQPHMFFITTKKAISKLAGLDNG
jgi:hypothetical protein